MKKIEYSTWCSESDKCGVNLASILNDMGDTYVIHKVALVLNNFSIRLKEAHKIGEFKEYFLHLLLHDTEKEVKSKNWPKKVESHLLSLIRGKFRNELNKK